MKFWLAWLGAGLLLGIAFDVAWWAVVAHPLDSALGDDHVVIPAGTAEAIRGGTPFAFAPDRFSIPAGGHLRVVNRDTVAHTVGATSIPAGASADVAASTSGELFCTIHPQGHLEVTLGASPPLAAMVTLVVVVCLVSLVAGWILRSPPEA